MQEESEIELVKNVIEVDDLHKSFGDLSVLKGISLTVDIGENVVILGKSGSGKSVLIKILIGLIKPDHGRINILGQELNSIDEKELNKLRIRIGFSFQNSALYDSMSVGDNILFPLKMNKKELSKQEINIAVEEVLEAVGLSNKMHVMPSDLSGGQRKRIGIARTLILRPEVMLYDEPTAGLDPITSSEINKLINQVQETYKTSSLIITHDLTCARETGNRVAILLDGSFRKIGKFEEVFHSDNEEIKKFYAYNFIH